MMARAVYRYEVPIDGRAHPLDLNGFPLRVAVQTDTQVMEFWAEHWEERPTETLHFQVYGTGHPVPHDAVYWGTADRVLGLVFHLYEVSHG
jgi:hypothetical protein